MTGSDDDRGSKKGLKIDDLLLWKSFTRGIDPINTVDWAEAEKNAIEPEEGKADIIEEKPVIQIKKPDKVKTAQQPPQLDRKTDERLRKGKMPIEARLDLHGYNQEIARELLREFLINARRQNKRCVLVITGTGKRSKRDGDDIYAPKAGVLRARLPECLSEKPVSEFVLKHYPAKQKDGGDGAFYIYLKKPGR